MELPAGSALLKTIEKQVRQEKMTEMIHSEMNLEAVLGQSAIFQRHVNARVVYESVDLGEVLQYRFGELPDRDQGS